MTTNTSKITGPIARVSRRRFLSGTAGAIATTGAILLPEQTIDSKEPISLEQMARALHEAVGRHSKLRAPFETDSSPEDKKRTGSSALDFAMEMLRDCSVDEIQCALKPLVVGVS